VIVSLKRMRDVVVVEGTEGRNPFEVLMLGWSVLSGVYFLFFEPPPGSITEDLPPLVVITWYTLLCIGGLVGLVGVWLRSLTLSLLVERAAMLIVAPSALLYTVALFSLSGSPVRAFGSASIVLTFAVSSLIRFIRINAHLQRLRTLIEVVARDE